MVAAIAAILLAINGIRSAYFYLVNSITTTISWATAQFNSLDNSIVLLRLIQQLDAEATNAALQALNLTLTNRENNNLKLLQNAIQVNVTALDDYINSLNTAVNNRINQLQTQEQTDVTNVYQDINVNIIGNLGGQIAGILKWIATIGAYMYGLLTNADALWTFLFKAFIGSWMSLLAKYAGLVIKWILANSVSQAPTFANVLEDIISSLFD